MTISLDAVAPDHHRITGPREPAKLDADHVAGLIAILGILAFVVMLFRQ
jgi:hypothetical protein